MANLKLGELLVKAGVLSEQQLQRGLQEQRRWGGKLGEVMVRMGFLAEDLLTRALSRQLGVAATQLEAIQGIPPAIKAKIPAQVARDLSVIPLQLRDDGRTLVVAMADPNNLEQLDTLRVLTRCRIVPQLAGKTALARAYARFYEGEDLGDDEGSFKVVDAQGRTLVKTLGDLKAQQQPEPNFAAVMGEGRRAPQSAASVPPPAAAPQQAAQKVDPAAVSADLLKAMEGLQKREVAALRAVIELLVEKGVFTREEFLAKVKR